MDQQYNDFITMIPADSKIFVEDINTLLLNNHGKRNLEPSAKGYLVRYTLSGKSLLNYVFRKGTIKARIYAANVEKYQEIINEFPEETKKEIASALDCKKLTGKPCSPTCPAGYTFIMDGVEYKKCRSMAFLPSLNERNNPVIRKMIENEVFYINNKQ